MCQVCFTVQLKDFKSMQEQIISAIPFSDWSSVWAENLMSLFDLPPESLHKHDFLNNAVLLLGKFIDTFLVQLVDQGAVFWGACSVNEVQRYYLRI